jgi:hypothetical protein
VDVDLLNRNKFRVAADTPSNFACGSGPQAISWGWGAAYWAPSIQYDRLGKHSELHPPRREIISLQYPRPHAHQAPHSQGPGSSNSKYLDGFCLLSITDRLIGQS